MPRGDGDTRQRALEAAQRLFSQRGYDKTTMTDIAEELGVTSAALYYHFDSKDALLCLLVEPLLVAVDHVIARAKRPEGEPRTNRTLLAEYFEVLVRLQPTVCIVAHDAAVLHHPEVGARLRDQRALLEEMLYGDGTQARPKVLAAAALGALWQPVTSLDQRDLHSYSDAIVDAAARALGVPTG